MVRCDLSFDLRHLADQKKRDKLVPVLKVPTNRDLGFSSGRDSLTDEFHHAIRDAVHRTGDLDLSFLLQIRQYRASPPNVFD